MHHSSFSHSVILSTLCLDSAGQELFLQYNRKQVLLIALATLIGCLFVYLFFLMIQQIMKLSEDNTFNIENLVNASGQVYIPIPENMNGKGKVQISVKGAHHELDAMTEGGDRLASGTSVIVEKLKTKY